MLTVRAGVGIASLYKSYKFRNEERTMEKDKACSSFKNLKVYKRPRNLQ